MTMPLRAAIFDMDGLMIDSERIYTECSNAVLAEWGKTLTWEVKATLMGRPAHESAKRLVAATGVPISPEEFSARMDALLAPAFRHVQPLPGIQRLIDHLVEHEVPIAIATGSKRSNFNIKSSNLGPLFQPFGDRVVCGDDETVIGRGKPDPAIFHEAAKMLGITEPEQLAECLVFEDGRESQGIPTSPREKADAVRQCKGWKQHWQVACRCAKALDSF